MKRIFWAAILTLLLCLLGVVGDSIFGVDNSVWKVIESAINFPGTLMSKVAGPGHGFRQLVLPFIVSLAFYFMFFWILLLIFQPSGRQHALKSTHR